MVQVGAFQVEAGCDSMIAGNFLKVAMPDGRVLYIYAKSNDIEVHGGESLLEVWPNQEAVDKLQLGQVKWLGF